MRNLYFEAMDAYNAASLNYEGYTPFLRAVLVEVEGKLVGAMSRNDLHAWIGATDYAPRQWEDCEIRHDLVLYCFDDTDIDPCIILRRGPVNGIEGWKAEVLPIVSDQPSDLQNLRVHSTQYLPKECA